MSGSDFLDDLRGELVQAAVRQHRRRAVRIRIAMLALPLCLLGAGLMAVTRPAPAAADVQVAVEDGRVELTLHDLEHDPVEIEAAARRAGLHVSVTAVAAGPSLVGRFVGEAATGAAPAELRLVGQAGGGFAGFSVPVRWPGTLTLRVGRPAHGDEPYATFSDALARGEPLACRPLIGRPASEAATALATTSLVVTVETVGERVPAIVPLEAVRVGDQGRWIVVGADATSPRSVVLRIQRPGAPIPPPPRC